MLLAAEEQEMQQQVVIRLNANRHLCRLCTHVQIRTCARAHLSGQVSKDVKAIQRKHHVRQDQIVAYRTVFDAIDTDKSGLIDQVPTS